MIPGNDEVIWKSGIIPLADDFSSFGNGPPQFIQHIPQSYFFGVKGRNQITTFLEFWNRFETCLQLHTGN